MNTILAKAGSSLKHFAADEEGSQVVEYALIIALVSIGLALALSGTVGGAGLRSAFVTLVGRVTSCFTAAASTC